MALMPLTHAHVEIFTCNENHFHYFFRLAQKVLPCICVTCHIRIHMHNGTTRTHMHNMYAYHVGHDKMSCIHKNCLVRLAPGRAFRCYDNMHTFIREVATQQPTIITHISVHDLRGHMHTSTQKYRNVQIETHAGKCRQRHRDTHQ